MAAPEPPRFEDDEFTGLAAGEIEMADALLHWTRFEDCRLTGVRFGDLRRDPVGIGVTFERSDLRLASFRDLDLRNCAFQGCHAHEAEFVECDLRGVDFDGTDLARATFLRCALADADLRGARNYVIDARQNRVTGLRVRLPEALGMLSALGLELDG